MHLIVVTRETSKILEYAITLSRAAYRANCIPNRRFVELAVWQIGSHINLVITESRNIARTL